MFDAVTASAAGELDDVLLSLHRFGAEHPGVQDILDMERLKTATYSFEAPLRAGALLAGAPADVAERLAQAGAMLGVGYQVVDDVLGTFGDGDLVQGADPGARGAGDRDGRGRARRPGRARA